MPTTTTRKKPTEKRASSAEATYKKPKPQRGLASIDIPLTNEDGTSAGFVPVRVGKNATENIQKTIMALARARHLDIPINEEHPFVIEAVEEYGQPLAHALRKVHAIYEEENNFCLLFGGIIAVTDGLFADMRDGKRLVVRLAQDIRYKGSDGEMVQITVPSPDENYWQNEKTNSELSEDNFPLLPPYNHANPLEVKVALLQQLFIHWPNTMIDMMEIVANMLQGITVDDILKGEDNAESAVVDRFRNDGAGLDGNTPD